MQGEMFTFYVALLNKELRKCAHLTHCLLYLSGDKSSKSASLGLVLLRPVLKQHEGYFGTALIILSHGEMSRTTPKLALPYSSLRMGFSRRPRAAIGP
ncbi:hypothetical protein AVEN_177041-1 [Araneus ventricosus]|uniref:Uncharacterized protein n=1 Tax=Araneus ventricosus TaxID=182803 RepID=A0A4Y2CTE8_ARAVE|nr:hypothetical protein AVEN_177041-1 [Araneus ventricosus]